MEFRVCLGFCAYRCTILAKEFHALPPRNARPFPELYYIFPALPQKRTATTQNLDVAPYPTNDQMGAYHNITWQGCLDFIEILEQEVLPQLSPQCRCHDFSIFCLFTWHWWLTTMFTVICRYLCRFDMVRLKWLIHVALETESPGWWHLQYHPISHNRVLALRRFS